MSGFAALVPLGAGCPELAAGVARPSDDEEEEDGEAASESGEDLRPPGASPGAPRPPGALHPSLGSESHGLGACKRCCFFPRGRCANGYECIFCHYEHDKRRRKKKVRKVVLAAPQRASGGRLKSSGWPPAGAERPQPVPEQRLMGATIFAMPGASAVRHEVPVYYNSSPYDGTFCVVHPSQMVLATENFALQQRVLLEPAYMPQQHQQGGQTVAEPYALGIPPPPAQSPRVWRQAWAGGLG